MTFRGVTTPLRSPIALAFALSLGCGGAELPKRRRVEPVEDDAPVRSPARVRALRARAALHARLREAKGEPPALEGVLAELLEVRRAFLVAAEGETSERSRVDVLYELLQAATGSYDLFLEAWSDRLPYDWEDFPIPALDLAAPIVRQAREAMISPAARDCHDFAERAGIARAHVGMCNEIARVYQLDSDDRPLPYPPSSRAPARGPGVYRLREVPSLATTHLGDCAFSGTAWLHQDLYADATSARVAVRLIGHARLERLALPARTGDPYVARLASPVQGEVFLRASSRVFALGARLEAAKSLVWAEPGTAVAAVAGAKPGEASISPEPSGCERYPGRSCATLEKAPLKPSTVRCETMTLRGSVASPFRAPAGATEALVLAKTLHLSLTPKQPALAMLGAVTDAYVLERRAGFVRVTGWEDPWAFEGWAPEAEIGAAPSGGFYEIEGPWTIGSPHRSKAPGLAVRLKSTGSPTGLTLDPATTVVVNRRSGDDCSIVIPRVLTPTRDDAFVTSCAGLEATEAERAW